MSSYDIIYLIIAVLTLLANIFPQIQSLYRLYKRKKRKRSKSDYISSGLSYQKQTKVSGPPERESTYLDAEIKKEETYHD